MSASSIETSSDWQVSLQQLNCQPSEQQLTKLQAYLVLLQRWNKVYNLTAVRNPDDMLALHLFDSLAVADYIQGDYCLDVGSGAGLPGIPLAIMQPERQFTLLDTNGKKTRFIQQAIIELQLKNAKVVQTRVETWQPPQPFDAIISRAFASITDFIDSSLQHLHAEGCLYAMKGQLIASEWDQLPDSVSIRKTHRLQVPRVNAERHLIEIVPMLDSID
jgi:16S rRNA (guanine527-N7)-methyltransferase